MLRSIVPATVPSGVVAVMVNASEDKAHVTAVMFEV